MLTEGGTRTLNLVTILTTAKEQPFYVGLTGFVYGSGAFWGLLWGVLWLIVQRPGDGWIFCMYSV